MVKPKMPTTPSNIQHNVNPVEVIGVVDSVNTDQNTKSNGTPENNLPTNSFRKL